MFTLASRSLRVFLPGIWGVRVRQNRSNDARRPEEAHGSLPGQNPDKNYPKP